MGKQDYRGQAAQVETVAVIELSALGDPLDREELSLNEIRRRCGYKEITRCLTCNHPDRKKIEQAVMTESAGLVAKRYGMSKPALLNHMRHHFVVPE